jgi:hypothetical protein
MQVTRRTEEAARPAREGPSRTLRTLQRVLGETARRGEAYVLEVLPDAFSWPVPAHSLGFREAYMGKF